MKIMKSLVLSAVVLSGAAFHLQAQNVSEADYKTACEFMDALQVRQTMRDTVDGMLNVPGLPIGNVPELKNVVRSFMEKYVNYDRIKPELAKIYLRNFTPDELKKLTAFFQTPLGKKFAGSNSRIAIESARLGQKAVMDHMPELQQEIMKVMLKKQSGK